MIIVSDTTTITNLWQVGKLDILRKMYGEVIVPEAVWKELMAVPEQAAYFHANDWLQVRISKDKMMVQQLLSELDLGEAEAISLSLELGADFLIIDEALGRRKAERLHIKVIGLLGILLKAKHDAYIDLVKPILEDLESQAGFFINPKLHKKVLRLADESSMMAMKSREIKLLDVVALLTDLPAHGLHLGRVGTVIEQLAPDVWEVEFSNSDGETLAMLPLQEQDLLLLHFEAVAA